MFDEDVSVEDLYGLYKDWLQDYEIDTAGTVDHYKMNAEDLARLEMLDKKNLVWTMHGTCEDNQISAGFKIFGNCELTGAEASGCGCYQSHNYFVGKIPHKGENDAGIHIPVSAYLPCPVCNSDGEGEGDPDCSGPNVPEGIDMEECMDGFIRCYWD